MVQVDPARIPNDERPIGWRFAAARLSQSRAATCPFAAAKARLRLPADLAEREAQTPSVIL